MRELELHEEAGFHPLEVIAHATANGAKLLGMADRLGKVRVGFTAEGPEAEANGVRFDTALRGNGNAGHTYGSDLPPADRDAIIEYLKTR